MRIRLWKKSRKPSAIDKNTPDTPPCDKQDRKTEPSEDLKPAEAVASSSQMLPDNHSHNPARAGLCERCGACCAFFRVSFPSIETNMHSGGMVPIDLTTLLSENTSFMKGTDEKSNRCVALHGQVGFQVGCSIYENRPSSCRNFFRSWEEDTGNSLCDKARAAYGMEPFTRF